jgi:hypothetical protein
MRACLTHLYKQIGYAVEMNCWVTKFFETGAQIVAAASLFLFVSAWNWGCVTTTTPVNESGWLTKRDDSAAVQQDVKADGGLKAAGVNPGQEKPWDKPIPVEQKSAFVAPNAQQLKEYLAGATWVKLDENGTRRRSLLLNADGNFIAKSDGESGELPAFVGLKVQAKGTWSVKENELRLLPNAGDAVVVQLQWIGDKRIMMLDGESWIRSE